MTAPLSLVPPVVAATVERSYGHHRTPWFEEILARTATLLAGALGPRLPLFLTATTLGAREAVVANAVVPGQSVWTLPASGFADLVTLWHGRPVKFDLEHASDIATRAGCSPLVLLDHVDASGGVLDVVQIVRRIRSAASDALVVLDVSVSLGADIAALDHVDVDGVLMAPDGALMGIPGVSIVAAGDRLLEHVRRCREELHHCPYYFDLLRYENAWRKRTTPYSPNISAVVAMCKALELIEANGGLERHVAGHAARAATVRDALASCGLRAILPQGHATNAFTVLELPPDVELGPIGAVHPDDATLQTQSGERPGRVRIDHTGYLPEGALSRLLERLASTSSARHRLPVPRIADVTLRQQVPANIPPDTPLPIFDIPASDFVRQAAVHAERASGGAPFGQRIRDAARATFQDHHRYNPRTLTSRTLGFIGAGRITRHVVEKCRQLGVRKLTVYSPSLAAGYRGSGIDDPKGTRYWETRGVVIAGSAAEIFRQAHTIVLLPWFYDHRALQAFGKSASYLNEGLIDAGALALIEREGRADLLINAAARAALVDRRALLEAVSVGWLRYFSDELPSTDDPLLQLPQARFTGHVGGSCPQPQAAVARNTHRILRHLVEGGELESRADSGYGINVVNGTVERHVPWRTAGFSGPVRAPVRILITDPFDLETLDLDGLRAEGHAVEVLDVSAEQPAGRSLEQHLRAFRPHIWLLRSRTTVDQALAEALRHVPELAAIVRPGVGVDNLYGGLGEITRLGIRIINEPFGNSSAVAEMTLHFILSAAHDMLLAPGPTRFRPDVFEVMRHYGHPARRSFREAHRQVCRRMAEWFVTTSDTVVLSASGTGLMEAGIASLTQPGDRGLVISHGKFGDRFAEIAHARGRQVEVLRIEEAEWGRALTPADVRTRFGEFARTGERFAWVCLQQNETSSGVSFHAPQLRDIVDAARMHNAEMMIIVDAISGAFAHPIAFDALDLDLLITGSQKGLGISSGLAYGIVSRRALGRMLHFGGFEGSVDEWRRDAGAEAVVERFERRQSVRYLGLLRMVFEHDRAAFQEPPSIFHVLSSLRALEQHEADGGREAVLERHAAMGRLVRDGLAAAGLHAVSHPPFHSDSVTPALVADRTTASAVREQLQAFYGIAIAGAQGDYWKRQMIRIGHLGFVYPHDIARCVRALRILHESAEGAAVALNMPPAMGRGD